MFSVKSIYTSVLFYHERFREDDTNFLEIFSILKEQAGLDNP